MTRSALHTELADGTNYPPITQEALGLVDDDDAFALPKTQPAPPSWWTIAFWWAVGGALIVMTWSGVLFG